MIPYGRQQITDQDIAAVAAALADPFITQGPKVAEFEERLAAAVGARYAVALSSGTAALHAAYFAAGVASGATIITSPITFAATANAALYLGGRVQFADVDPRTVQLDPAAVESAAGKSVCAVVPVHFGGHAADVIALAEIAGRRGWRIIEDAAHALGARYRDVEGAEYRIGACAHSDMCCFSFHPVKHVTTGEGGAVTTNDRTVYRKLLRFRTHGITRDAAELIANEGAWYYEQHDLGYNYRMTDFQCALGISQLQRLEEFVAHRREIARLYDQEFAQDARLRPVSAPDGSIGSYHLYVVRVASAQRRRVFDGMRAAGIGVNVHYIPVYRHPYYQVRGFGGTYLPNAEAYYSEALSLPMYATLTRSEAAYIVEQIRRLVAEARQD